MKETPLDTKNRIPFIIALDNGDKLEVLMAPRFHEKLIEKMNWERDIIIVRGVHGSWYEINLKKICYINHSLAEEYDRMQEI